MPCPEKHLSAGPESHLIRAADSLRAGRDGLLPLGRPGAPRGRGPRAGGGDRKGRGNPRRSEHPLLERLSLSQDSCCGHTTNLKAVLPARSVPFLATLASPKLQLVPGSRLVPAPGSGGQQRPLPPGQASATAAAALRQGGRRLRGSARAAAPRSSRWGPGSPPRSPAACIPSPSRRRDTRQRGRPRSVRGR